MQDASYKSFPGNTALLEFQDKFGLPVIGHAIGFIKDLRGLVVSQIEKYGPVSKINVMGNKGLLVAGPDSIIGVLHKIPSFVLAQPCPPGRAALQ